MLPQRATATFTRPSNTTQYAANDLVANHGTAGSVVAMPFSITSDGGWVRQVSIHHSAASATNSSFRLWLFSSAPTMANGDNGAFAMSTPTFTTLLGNVDVTVDQLFGDTIGFTRVDPGLWVPHSFYGLLEARAAYTPESDEVFNVGIDIQGGSF